MRKIHQANNLRTTEQIGLTCQICGQKNSAQARFCGGCGQKLVCEFQGFSPPVQGGKCPLRFKQVSKQLFLKKMMLLAFIGFVLTFSFTLFFLHSSKVSYAGEKFFRDIPIDHQIYSDCKKLISLDGCRLLKGNRFAPYDKVTSEDVNQALLAIIRLNKIELSDHLLISRELFAAHKLPEHVKKLAEIVGKSKRYLELDSSRFDDQTRFNVFSALETVFLRETNEN